MIDQTDVVVKLIEKIDSLLPYKGPGKLYGLADIITGNGETFPATIPNRGRINPMDTWKIQTYHRQITSVRGDTTLEFGRSRTYVATMRNVVIADPVYGKDFIYAYLDAFPLQVVVNGASAFIDEQSIQTDHDHAAIALVEFGSAWEDKHRLVKNIWAVTYPLHLKLSPSCVEV